MTGRSSTSRLVTRLRSAFVASLSLVPVLAPAPSAAAQDPSSSADRPILTAAHLTSTPVLDGDVLTDAAWVGVSAATGFVQTTPDEGAPASERTAVFVGFDAETLYVGVVCHDREPDRIIVADTRRDASLDETDSFQVIFDTFGDRQTGFVFGTNPAGSQYDGQVTSDGDGTFNRNWDGAWHVAARIFDGGWSAEMAIPFRTLRFPAGDSQTWGVNFQRNIRRHNETSFWAPLPLQFGLSRVSLAGQLAEVRVPRQRLLQLTPYVLGAAAEGPEVDGTDTDTEAGFDLKYGFTPSLTLDATYNTDFAQVEADVQQINLDRFNLFFPEKRPFFLENAGIFSVGVPEEIELFFSRRIGIGPGGQTVPILGGLRLSGKAGRNNLGLLYMGTDEVEGVRSEDEFGVVRWSRDLGERSSLGMIFTQRQGQSPGDRNRTFGVDGRWGVSQTTQIHGFAARTESPGAEGDEHAFRVGASYDSERWYAGGNLTEVGEDFDPEVGFLTRRGYRKVDASVLARVRPDDFWGLHELRPHITYRGYWDFDGFQETGLVHIDNHWEFQSGHEVHTGINLTREGVKAPFEIFPGVVVPPGTYDHEELSLVAFTNLGAPVSVEANLTVGGLFGGDRVTFSPALRFRRGEKLNGELAWSYNDVDLPGGDFETHLGRLRLAYSFTPKIFVDGLLQYNDRLDQWSSNVRFGWRHDAATGFYVVYNDIQEIGTGAGEPQRQLIVKYSRLFDLFKG